MISGDPLAPTGVQPHPNTGTTAWAFASYIYGGAAAADSQGCTYFTNSNSMVFKRRVVEGEERGRERPHLPARVQLHSL